MEPLADRFVTALHTLGREWIRARRELANGLPAGASYGDLQVLRAIVGADLITMGELAARMKVTPATATAAVNRVVLNGWAVRVPDERDRRMIRLRVTNHGRRIHEYYQEFRSQFATRLLSRLSPDEAERLVELLERLTASR